MRRRTPAHAPTLREALSEREGVTWCSMHGHVAHICPHVLQKRRSPIRTRHETRGAKSEHVQSATTGSTRDGPCVCHKKNSYKSGEQYQAACPNVLIMDPQSRSSNSSPFVRYSKYSKARARTFFLESWELGQKTHITRFVCVQGLWQYLLIPPRLLRIIGKISRIFVRVLFCAWAIFYETYTNRRVSR